MAAEACLKKEKAEEEAAAPHQVRCRPAQKPKTAHSLTSPIRRGKAPPHGPMREQLVFCALLSNISSYSDSDLHGYLRTIYIVA